jgi:GH35 family endo-1,4-beta-xylanase
MVWAIESKTVESLPDIEPEKKSYDYALTRMGDLTIRVVGPDNVPVVGAVVSLEQTRHQFWFGSAIADTILKDDYHDAPGIVNNYEKIFTEYFNSGVFENAMNWYTTERWFGSIDYRDADKWLKWCEENNLPVRGHILFWEKEEWNLNEWLKGVDRDSLRRAVEKRAKEVTARYRGRIPEYDVVNEMLHGDFFRGRLGDNIIDQMFYWSHEGDQQAILYINDYLSDSADLIRYEKIIESLLKKGVPLGGIGVQAHFGDGPDRIPPPSQEEWQQLLDRLARFNLPIQVTEYGYDTTDEAKKAKYLVDFYRTCFSHPAVKGVQIWGFWEGAVWRPGAAIFNKDFSPKPAALAYQTLVLQELQTRASGTTDSGGKFSTRAFYGSYHVSAVGADGTKGERDITFGSNTPVEFSIVLRKPAAKQPQARPPVGCSR